jgi:hypothetical protein
MQLVTLTTDFGIKDYYVAELKASILKSTPNANFLDICHTIEAYDITEAAFFVKNILGEIAQDTIHIIAVNNYYSKNNKLIVAKAFNQIFVAPNNGVLSLVFNGSPFIAYEVDESNFESPSLQQMFSHVVGYLSHGLPIEEIGPICDNFVTKLELKPVVTSSQIRATIVHVDHYDNVIVNLKKAEFEKIRNGRKFAIYYKQNDPIDTLSNHFGDSHAGDVICFFNSGGYMTIAINMGKASKMLNLIKNETIQINFFD